MSKIILCILFATGTSHAAMVMTSFTVNGLEANQGTTDQTTLSHIQTLTQMTDFTGDGVVDTLVYRVTTTSTNGTTDFNPGSTQYTFRTAGGDYDMFVEVVSYTTVDPQFQVVDSFGGSLTAFFKSGNGSYSVTDGLTTLSSGANNTTVTSATALIFDDVSPLTWSGQGNNGPRNLGIEFKLTVIPEPSRALLLGLGLAGIFLRRHR